MIDKRPALIARCETADDVTAAIRFARDHDLRIAVRGGAHNGAGLASVDDGLVIDLSPMKSIAVDPAAQTVRVGAGSVWGEVDAATQPHNLAVPTGIISSTGVAGLTLGGGHGYLARRHGLTVDNLLAAKMVLADGSQVTVSASEHPDLFWAIRGGGGNFGVVTEFTFRAHPLETIVGGPTFWAIEQADELLTAYREWLPSAPRNVMGFFNFHTIPPVAEAFPEELHLRKVCGIVWCIDASDEDAEAAMAPILSVAEPLLHGVQRMPIAALNGAFDGLYGPGDQWYWRGDFVREIPDQAVVLNREWNERMPGFKAGTHLYPIDGAVQDVKAEDTAWAYRDATWSQVFIGCDPEPAKADALREWTVGYSEALRPYAAGAGYVNFMMDDEGAGRVKATYGANYPAPPAREGGVRPGERLPGEPEHPPRVRRVPGGRRPHPAPGHLPRSTSRVIRGRPVPRVARDHRPREAEGRRGHDEERHLRPLLRAAEPRAQVSVRRGERRRRARREVLAARRLRDPAQRVAVGRLGEPEDPVLAARVVGAERDRVDRDPGPRSHCRTCLGRQDAAELAPVGEEEDRHARDRVAGRRRRAGSGTSRARARRSARARRRSRCRPPPDWNGLIAAIVSWSTARSCVGTAATVGSPANVTRPTRSRSGTRSRNA